VADSSRIPLGAVAPYELRYYLRSSRFDLTKIATARFVLRRQNGKGAPEEWTATVSEKTPNTALLTHVFAAGELPSEELIVFEPRVTITGAGAGELVGATRTLVVIAHPSRL
jgi:hypothetical protein